MVFQVLALNHEWFFEPNANNNKFESLMKIINKAYSKSKYRYGIIKTDRIKNPGTFIDDLELKSFKEFTLLLLLGSVETFQRLEQDEGYKRDFTKSQKLDDIHNSDIPTKFKELFVVDFEDDFELIVADPCFDVNDQVINRVLCTAGFGSAKNIFENSKVREIKLTAFTSFMNRVAPKALDLFLEKIVLSPRSRSLLGFSSIDNVDKVILLADVIKQHNLVEYYSNHCKFIKSDREDILVEVLENGFLKNCPFENGITATSDFHISFINREITIKSD